MIKAPRGTHDVLPDEQPLWRLVADTLAEVAEQYGYRRIQTPNFEDTELFTRTSGQGSDVVQKEMYTFDDRSGRSLTLKPEGTASVARAYLEHGMHRDPQPVKLYAVAPMYRYEAPQRGRYREHWQYSVEAIGSDDPALDAEVIDLYSEFARRVGITRYELQVNSIGDENCRPTYLESLTAWLDEHSDVLTPEVEQKRKTSPLRVFDVKDERVKKALEDAPKIGESLCAACLDHFAAVREFLDALGIAYTIEPTLVRGLDYYTRTVFEFLNPEETAQPQICSGGRYDGLLEAIGGKSTPAIGFGAGIERALIALEDEGVTAPAPTVDVFFAFEDVGRRSDVLKLIAELRRAGRSVETDYGYRSLKGQRSFARRLGASTFVVVHTDSFTVERRGQEDRLIAALQELSEELL